MTNPNQELIDWLEKQEDKVCALIFTRGDADTWRGARDCEDVPLLTDTEWEQTLHDFDRHFLDDYTWESFGECIPVFGGIWNET